MVTITLYAKQKKRHRCIEQTFGLCVRRRGWDVSREQHRNMYTILGETDDQPRLDAWYKCSDLVHWEDPEGLGGEGGGRWDPRLIHVNVWQKPLQYCKVTRLQLIKKKKKSLQKLLQGNVYMHINKHRDKYFIKKNEMQIKICMGRTKKEAGKKSNLTKTVFVQILSRIWLRYIL